MRERGTGDLRNEAYQLSVGPGPLNHTKDLGMHDPPGRRFTLADAMLFVAATAPGLVLLRIAAGLGLFSTEPVPNEPWGREFIEYLAIAGGCLLVPIAPPGTGPEPSGPPDPEPRHRSRSGVRGLRRLGCRFGPPDRLLRRPSRQSRRAQSFY